jgi:hypothetical protein
MREVECRHCGARVAVGACSSSVLFGVLRIDASEDRLAPIDEDDVSLTSIFTTQEAAERDAARLNEIAQARGIKARYLALVSRLKE